MNANQTTGLVPVVIPDLPLPFPFLPEGEMVEEPIMPPPQQETELKSKITPAVMAPRGSILMHKLNEWEVRLTPMNKVFVFNSLRDQIQWPYLDKKGTAKLTVAHSGVKSTEPPQAILDTAKRILTAKRTIRQSHSEDFVETESQHVYS